MLQFLIILAFGIFNYYLCKLQIFMFGSYFSCRKSSKILRFTPHLAMFVFALVGAILVFIALNASTPPYDMDRGFIEQVKESLEQGRRNREIIAESLGAFTSIFFPISAMCFFSVIPLAIFINQLLYKIIVDKSAEISMAVSKGLLSPLSTELSETQIEVLIVVVNCYLLITTILDLYEYKNGSLKIFLLNKTR